MMSSDGIPAFAGMTDIINSGGDLIFTLQIFAFLAGLYLLIMGWMKFFLA